MYSQQSNAAISRYHVIIFTSINVDKFHTTATFETDYIICYIVSPDIVVSFDPTTNTQQSKIQPTTITKRIYCATVYDNIFTNYTRFKNKLLYKHVLL